MTTNDPILNVHQPVEMDEARGLLLLFPDAVIMAGGQHLIPSWRQSVVPGTIISLTRIPALRDIKQNGNTLTLGAAVTLSELAGSEVIKNNLPALAGLAANMGDRFMRNRATIAGALCSTQLAGCIPAALLGTKAVIHTTTRDIASHDWFQASGSGVMLEQGELIVGVSLDIPDAASHQNLRLNSGRFALLTVFATRTGAEFTVGISGLSASAFRATTAEVWLASGHADDTAGLDPMFQEHPARNDLDASSAYREAQMRRLLQRVAQHLG